MDPHDSPTTTIQHGGVSVTFDASLALDPRAGKLSAEEVLRIAKAPRGLGLVCDLTAASMEAAGTAFVPPQGVEAGTLRRLGTRAEGYETLLTALDVVRDRIAQANLLADAEAWEALRKVNDMVKAQGKHAAELEGMFAPLRDFVRRARTKAPSAT